MQHLEMPPAFTNSRCRVWPRLGLFCLALVLVAASAGISLTSLRTPPEPVKDDVTACATPDSLAPALPFPEKQRLRHLIQLGVDRWHAAGYKGQHTKIAVLDSGFRGYRSQLGKALPQHVTVHSFRADGDLEARDSQHGILCAEVMHALAPSAELLFANWEPDRSDQFLDAIRWARSQGARILSCSLIMPSWSDGEGNGPVHQSLVKLLGRSSGMADGLCFASAGNTALRHWSGAFHDHGDGWHEWEPGRCTNLILPWGEERVSVEMYWQGTAEYQIRVVDAQTGREVGACPTCRSRDQRCLAHRFTPQPRHHYELSVRLLRGQPGQFHVAVLGAGLQLAQCRGSIPFPGDGEEVIAVGAVDEEGHRASYSSCGPNSRIPKPDFVAVVPFCSLWRERPFSGTSAAAPQAAALAALLWSRNPGWSASQVREALQTSARHLGPSGHDDETGYGCVALPRLP
jgi:hypothetical protein